MIMKTIILKSPFVVFIPNVCGDFCKNVQEEEQISDQY